jgi:drug/metabolite transporter (DMT)-like permease
MKSFSFNGNRITQGILLAILATIIWSGNFIIARGVIHEIPPIALAFLRWACASVIMIPFGWKNIKAQWPDIKENWVHLFWAGLTGISLFNTFVYIAGHFTEAINLALIGTTSSPIFSFILARIFLKEKITPLKLAGLIFCIAGVLIILSRGDINNLIHFRITDGDLWVLIGAFSFSVYNVIARKKPVNLTPVTYLTVTFWIGTLLIFPFAMWELYVHPTGILWNVSLVLIILYLGAGASVISFFCWNAAIARLGAARASIFGNLIPVFSSLEAVWLLHEKISPTHIAGMVLVFSGVFLANKKPGEKKR